MLKNYLKIAIRFFWKQKLTSTINIIGLSVGIACAGLAFIFIQHELSFDRFHQESDRIFWLSAAIENKVNISSTPAPLSPQLKESLPEVSESFRLENHEMLVQSGNEFFKEMGHFVDPNFFSFFSFELLAGQPDQVFTHPNSLVLTKEMARKYFGRLNPVGQNLTINYQGREEIFEVTGIASEAPQNSSLQFNFLLPLQFLYQDQPEMLAGNWNNFPVTSFIRIREPEDLEILEQKLPEFAAEKVKIDGLGDDKLIFMIRALQNYHLKDQYFANGLTEPADMDYVRILGLIALLILLVACLNFMNLTNAKGSVRLLEVGVRKVLGAARKQVLGQFLTEALLMSFLSLGLSILLIESALPFISKITSVPLEVKWLQPVVFFPLVGIATLTGLLAGIYPSMLLSRLKPVQTFKNTFKAGGDNLVTKSSLVFQFALSIGLLSCTLIMYRQQQFIKNRNLGFNKEEIMVIPTQENRDDAPESHRLVEQFKREILADPKVLQVSGVSQSFNKGNSALFVKEEDGSQVPVFFYTVDPDYIPLLDIELRRGRNFSAAMGEDQNKSILVNNAFLKHFEIQAPIEDYRLPEKFSNLAGSRIIGVVDDYNYLNLKSEVRPLILQMSEDQLLGHVLVKINPEEVDQTIAFLRSSWQKINPSKPFEFSFLDEDIQKQYLIEDRWNRAITAATILAVLIACLGLFGLIALILTEKTKEIGIRKILGASVPNIAWLISRQFVGLLSLATLIAVPVAWWAMQKWMENFAYKIDIHVFFFAAALGIILVIALLTTGLQSAKAAMQNPVESLRHE